MKAKWKQTHKLYIILVHDQIEISMTTLHFLPPGPTLKSEV